MHNDHETINQARAEREQTSAWEAIETLWRYEPGAAVAAARELLGGAEQLALAAQSAAIVLASGRVAPRAHAARQRMLTAIAVDEECAW